MGPTASRALKWQARDFVMWESRDQATKFTKFSVFSE